VEERLSAILSAYQGKKDELIPILQQVQGDYGYLPEPEMLEIARFTKLPESRGLRGGDLLMPSSASPPSQEPG